MKMLHMILDNNKKYINLSCSLDALIHKSMLNANKFKLYKSFMNAQFWFVFSILKGKKFILAHPTTQLFAFWTVIRIIAE
jgi:hypothetical protein